MVIHCTLAYHQFGVVYKLAILVNNYHAVPRGSLECDRLDEADLTVDQMG